MEKISLKKALAVLVALGIPVAMSGCSKQVECDVPVRHLHLYKKNISGTLNISKYVDSEAEDYWGYTRTPEYMEITKDDEDFYKAAKELYNGEDNWPYLFAVMKSNPDFLEFYYEYTTIETYTTTDSKGHTQTHTRTVHHDGWHKNAKDGDNTGKVRVGHYRYHGFRVIQKNGKYERQKSRSVDDIRDIIYDYPYFEDDPRDLVYSYHHCNKRDLPKLTPASFASDFNHPRLDTTDINLNKSENTQNELTANSDNVPTIVVDRNSGKVYIKERKYD